MEAWKGSKLDATRTLHLLLTLFPRMDCLCLLLALSHPWIFALLLLYLSAFYFLGLLLLFLLQFEPWSSPAASSLSVPGSVPGFCCPMGGESPGLEEKMRALCGVKGRGYGEGLQESHSLVWHCFKQSCPGGK